MAFNLFPYSNFHKLNLDWVIKTIREAKEALDQAAQTVIGYESRLAAVESSVSTLSSSVNLLRVTVNGHTLRLDQAQSDIANHTQQINSMDSRLSLAEQAAQAAEQTAQAAEQTAQAAEQTAQAIQTSKMNRTNPIGSGTLIMNAATMDDGLVLQDTVMTGVKFKASSRGLSLVSMSAGSEQPSQRVQISGVETPTTNNDAATKGYVDGTSNTVTGTTVEITPANNNIYQCGALDQLTITNPPSTGAYSIIFTSGATPTTTIIPATVLGLETFVAAANTIYEINVLDNRAVVGSWEVASA